MKNILTEALVNSATNASFIFSYTNSAKLRIYVGKGMVILTIPFLADLPKGLDLYYNM